MFVNTHSTVIGHVLDCLYLCDLQELRLNFTDLADEMYSWPKAAIQNLRKRCLPPLAEVSIAGKFIFEKDLAEFVCEMKYLERLEVTYGPCELVTPHVRGLLPQNNDAVLQQRAAYSEEIQKMMVYLRYAPTLLPPTS